MVTNERGNVALEHRRIAFDHVLIVHLGFVELADNYIRYRKTNEIVKAILKWKFEIEEHKCKKHDMKT